MIKNMIALVLTILFSLDIFNGYQWYCDELVLLGNIYLKFFSICTLLYIINSMVSVGILAILTKYSYKLISAVLFSLIILKIFLLAINNGLNFALLYDNSLAYFGNFLGVLLGVIYFKKIINIKKGLLSLLLIWLIVNIVYPSINF